MTESGTNPIDKARKCGVCLINGATIQLECKHGVCETCIKSWIRNCLIDVTKIPPQCCNKYIPLPRLEELLVSLCKESDRIKFWKLLETVHITCSNCGNYYTSGP